MEILFIGGLFPPDRKKEFIEMSKGTIQFAADTLQWSFIKGLDAYTDNVTIFTAPLLGNFPKTYKKLYIKNSEFYHNSTSKDYCVGYLLIPMIGLISKSINIYRSLLKKVRAENPYLLVYCVHTPFLLAAVRYKKRFPDSKICLIVTDLPQYMSAKTGKLYTFFKRIDLNIINKLIESVDSFVFITDMMASQFNVGFKPWVRIEGIYDTHPIIEAKSVDNSAQKIILYTGTLDSRYGILDLLEAFKLIHDSDYQLWICGDGNMKKHILEYLRTDRRVKYFGQVSKDEAIGLQQKATILVNPRTSEGEYTKYSFPIKTMEYLASGKPCIMHRLPGIPHEYIEHLFIPENQTPFGLSKKIVEVCNMDVKLREIKCEKSKSFILNNKNPGKQVFKLISLLNG